MRMVREFGWGTWIRTRINGVRVLYSYPIQLHHTPRARSPAVWSIASGFIPPNPLAVSPNEEGRFALDAQARPGLEKRDTVQSMSRGRSAALGSIMSTLERRRDQMFPKLRPEEIDRLRRFGEIRRLCKGNGLKSRFGTVVTTECSNPGSSSAHGHGVRSLPLRPAWRRCLLRAGSCRRKPRRSAG